MTDESGGEGASNAEQWADQVRANRAEKDDFFAEHPQSPIPPEERDEFDGLSYFDPDPKYRVRAHVTVNEDPDPVDVETSDGRTVRYERVATFEFHLDGETHTLAGYRQDADDDEVFVPFRDRTTGQETYDGGRYVELETERELTDDEIVVLDFNLAYTPFCAYSDTFSCPLSPEENWLETTIRAGEKDWSR